MPEDSFKAQQLRSRHLVGASLILPLTTWHRARVLTQLPMVRNKTFTLLEFARIVGAAEFPRIPDGSVPRRLRTMVRCAAGLRGIGEYVNDDDVPDPYGQGPEVTEHAFQLMVAAVDTIVRVARR